MYKKKSLFNEKDENQSNELTDKELFLPNPEALLTDRTKGRDIGIFSGVNKDKSSFGNNSRKIAD